MTEIDQDWPTNPFAQVPERIRNDWFEALAPMLRIDGGEENYVRAGEEFLKSGRKPQLPENAKKFEQYCTRLSARLAELRERMSHTGKRTYTNKIDQVMRQPATEFKGPKDPDLEIVINYTRAMQMKHEKAKRSWFAEQIDPDLWNKAAEGRWISKPKAYRRF